MNPKNLKFLMVLLVLAFSLILLTNDLTFAKEKAAGSIRFASRDEVKLASHVVGLRRCETAQDYEDTEGWCYSMTDKIAYTTDYYIGYAIFIDDPQDGERYTWQYYYPDGKLYTEQYWEFYIDPEYGCCWVSSLGHKACSGCAAFLMMGFYVYNNPYIKPGLWEVRVYRDGTLFGSDNFTIKCGESIEIIRPKEGDDFDLTQNYTATSDITFEAVFEPSTITEPINWTLDLEYLTSGGRCGCSNQRSFTTDPNEQHSEFYESMGGQLTINASATVNECQVQAEPVIVTITGVTIPETLITDRLVQLYHGPTARLMTGLAQVESSYLQFSTRTLYNRTDLWPQESYDGGSHIGLMQVVTTMEWAWNWLENTRYGVNFFQGEKMRIARFWQRQIRQEAREKYGCHLRPLNRVELENMALVLYGEHAKNAIDGQYYYYVTHDGNCDWIVNTQGNPDGVAYANRVRDSMR